MKKKLKSNILLLCSLIIIGVLLWTNYGLHEACVKYEDELKYIKSRQEDSNVSDNAYVNDNQEYEQIFKDYKEVLDKLIEEEMKVAGLSEELGAANQLIETLLTISNSSSDGNTIENNTSIVVSISEEEEILDLVDNFRLGNLEDAFETMYIEQSMFSDEEFEELRNIIVDMMDIVFQDGEEIEVTLFEEINNFYIVEDTNSNSFLVRKNTFEEPYRLYCNMYTALWSSYIMKDFVMALNNQDFELMERVMIEDDLSPTEDEIAYVFERYCEEFDIDTIEYQFSGIDLNGFVYELRDGSGNVGYVHVGYGDGILFIADYMGRYEWTGHKLLYD